MFKHVKESKSVVNSESSELLCVLMLDKVAQFEYIGLTEVLLELIKLVGTNGIKISSLKLLLEHTLTEMLVDENSLATEVISQKSGVFLVLKIIRIGIVISWQILSGVEILRWLHGVFKPLSRSLGHFSF